MSNALAAHLTPELIRQVAASEHLSHWARMIWPDFELPVHVTELIAALEAVERGEIKRLMVSMPPRHGKSLLSSIAFPSWYLGRHPEHEVMIASYSASLSEGFSRQARNAIEAFGEPVFGVKVSGDTRSVESWALAGARGKFHSLGVGGSATGKGAHLAVIDDPVKDAEAAFSEIQRQAVKDWYASVLRTRLSLKPEGAIVLTMTRWHEDDLAGWLLEQEKADGEKWHKVVFPMVDDTGQNSVETGRILWPERFSRKAVLDLRRAVGPMVWEALYQQRPSNPEGSILKKAWFRYYRHRPRKCDSVIASWDCSFKDTKGSDYVAGQVWGRVGPDAYLLDQIHGRMGFSDTVSAVVALRKKWPEARLTLIEDKANGPAVVDTLKKKVPGVVAVKPEGGKESRAFAVQAYFEAGNVYFPDPEIAPWIVDTAAEMVAFPHGPHDDRVDACTQALLRLMQGAGGYWSAIPEAAPGGPDRDDGDGWLRRL